MLSKYAIFCIKNIARIVKRHQNSPTSVIDTSIKGLYVELIIMLRPKIMNIMALMYVAKIKKNCQDRQ